MWHRLLVIRWNRKNIINSLSDFSKNNCFQPIDKNNATKVNLVTIGRNIQFKLDDILKEHLEDIHTIIIENQIGPIANKMKTKSFCLERELISKPILFPNQEIKYN